MVDDPATEPKLLLSMLPAGRVERLLAIVAALLSVLTFVIVVPFARLPLPPIIAFIPAYEAALVIVDMITTVLLLGQFAITRSRPLLVLASGYLFTAFMTIVHALSFPGLFAESGLLGAGTQSTAWIYMFWHGGFPVVVFYYALLKRDDAQSVRTATAPAIAFSIIAVAALVVVLTALVTVGEALLPAIMQGHGYTPSMIIVVTTVWSLSLLALIVLFVRKPHSILDVCLMVVLCAWLCDIALSAVFNAGRFDLGFYAGRIYGLLAASVVLVVLLLETVTLYARLASSVVAERQEREWRLRELRSELIHVSRLGELGQMVSALAHEVNQPLTAIGNYVRAALRLMQAGDTARTRIALEKAADETGRANEIIRRLRDFTRKKESERRAEQLDTLIEEAIALALAGAERQMTAVELRLHPAATVASVDKIQIQQVLLNLIRNAIEAMAGQPRPTLVIATVLAGDDMVEVSVTDNGPGLPAEVRQKLFQPFVTTKREGMGVGLSICRSIIEAHGGRLWVEDNTGTGTVFRFTVPQGADTVVAA